MDYLVIKPFGWQGKSYSPGDIIENPKDDLKKISRKPKSSIVGGNKKALKDLWAKEYAPKPKPKAEPKEPKDNKENTIKAGK